MKGILLLFTFGVFLVTPGRTQNTYPYPSSGNLGLGTTSPLTILELKATTPIITLSPSNYTSTYRTTLGTRSGAEAFLILGNNGQNEIRAGNSVTGGYLDFYTNNTVDQTQASNGNLAMRLASSGNVGIKTTSPEVAFHVNGQSRFNGSGWFSRNNNGSQAQALLLGQNLNYDYPVVELSTSDDGGSNYSYWFGTRWGHHVKFQRSSSVGTKTMVQVGGTDGQHYVSVFSTDGSSENIRLVGDGPSWMSGGLAIGTTNTQGYKLAVNGEAIFTKAKVKQYSSWPDYVFHSTYRLRPLSELEKYIQQFRHLPDVPSATEIEQNGLDLGDNQAVLLKKIEELTLYIIELNKKLEAQQTEINVLKQTSEKSR